MKKIEVLMSTTEIKNKKEFKKKIEEANIKTDTIIVNQVPEIENQIIESKKLNSNQIMYSYKEKGASKSRNRLLELSKGEISIFADNDIKYVDDYEEIIKKAYEKNKEADGILFYVENTNRQREKNKKVKNKKVKFLDVMRLRIYELTLKKEAIEKIKEKGIRFDENFGPGAKIYKGEDTIFLSDLVKNKIKLYSVEQKIGTVGATESSWFKGFNNKYLYDQGAIFKRIAPSLYWILIIQYAIRKHKLYKHNCSILESTKIMFKGAKEQKQT